MKAIIYPILKVIDITIVKIARWKHIPNSTTNFLYLNPYQYKGKPLTLKDGTQISKGDWIAELHIDNVRSASMDTSYGNLLRLVRSELLTLKMSLDQEPYSQLKAVYCITVFYDIISRQGFTAVEISNKFKKFFGSVWENILRLGLKKGNKKTRKKFIYSKECWLSKDQILKMN